MTTLPRNAVAPLGAPAATPRHKGPSLRQLYGRFDWASTTLGPIQDWPQNLRSAVTLLMDSVQPMVIWWGDDSLQIYNDAYAPRVDCGTAEIALGKPAADSWKQGWETVRPLAKVVVDGGPSVAYSDFIYPIGRDGWVEDTFWTYSFTPVRDDAGVAKGVLLLSEETTDRNLSVRRQQTLDLLREELSRANASNELDLSVEHAVVLNPHDLYDVRTVSLRELQPLSFERPLQAHITALEVGYDVDLALVFDLSPRVAFNASYQRFLEQFTLLVASARQRIDSEALRRIIEAERDRLLLDAPVGAAVMIGEELVYQLVNSMYAMVSGRPAGSMVGKPFVEVFPELRNSPVHVQFKAVYQAGEPYVSQPTLVQIHRNGGILDDRYFTYNLSPLRTARGEVYGLMVIAIDITVEVESRTHVERLNAELQVAAGAKDEFLALLGHELRNPLSPIVTALDLMGMRDKSTEREQVIIRRQVTHLTRLVDDLLDVSRITRGKVELRKQLVDIPEVLASAVEMVAPLIEQRHQQLFAEVTSAHWYGDPARLAQIVSNLLTNASRYSPSAAQIFLRAEVSGPELKIEVSDNGSGLTAELIPRIFEPFVQGNRKMHSSVGGLGIGLALVKNLTEMHGGRVKAVSSGPEKGSTFTVYLPLDIDERARTEAEAAAPRTVTNHRCKVLVVDDNEDAAEMLAEALRMYGHEAVVAYTPEAALQLFTEHDLDLAILDIGLPGMSGHELAGLMRDVGSNPDIRYVALSGFGQDTDKERSAAAGFSFHLVKPLKLEELESLFDELT